MSITFHCPCGNEMTVSEEMKGKRGKCPSCGRLLKVPEQSVTELVFDDHSYFDDENLDMLFEIFLDEYDDDIIACKVLGKGMVKLEIATGGGRSQLLFLEHILKDDLDVLLATSSMGRNASMEGFPEILTDIALNLSSYPTYSVKMSKMNDGRSQIKLQKCVEIKHVDEEILFQMTIHLAKLADEVEGKWYVNDVC